MKDEPRDFPFDEIEEQFRKQITMGYWLYQKFTCDKCGQRLSMETPNTLYETGSCDKCGHITNIKEKGCNFLLSTRRLPGT